MKGNLLKLIFSIIFTIIFSLILVNFQSESTITTSTENATTTSTENATTTSTENATTTSTTSTSTIESSTTTEAFSATTTFTETLIEENQESTEENMREETSEESIETLQSIETPQVQIQQESLPPLKQRKLEKEVKMDFSAPYSCRAKNFSIDISNKNQAIIEIELLGTKPQNSTLEIGNLPLGIDITFLNTASYIWNPLPNETTAVLQIINQPGSQKGNFNIIILYTDNSTQKSSICQVNIVNL